MDSSTDSTMPGADVYTKRWEPQEERDARGNVYDELARILLESECRDELCWFDGRPVFPQKRPEPKAQSAEAERPKGLNV